MRSTVNGDSRLSLWRHVRDYAVPPSMIRSATARRVVGDWSGACAAARVDVDVDLRSLARTSGRELAARVRADLRHLAPDLLRWHLPRVAPDGLLRPGLTLCLARYRREDGGTLQLVARTPPGWADGGQRFSLAVCDEAGAGDRGGHHPHPRPNPRFRLDLHRHLWDARRSAELRTRAGLDPPPGEGQPGQPPDGGRYDPEYNRLRDLGCAVDRWADEAALLLRAEGRADDRAGAWADDRAGSWGDDQADGRFDSRAGSRAEGRAGVGAVVVRLGGRRRLVLELTGEPGGVRIVAEPAVTRAARLPMLPDAATWVPPDVALLRAGLISADRLHPLVAAALAPDHQVGEPSDPPAGPRLVECRGAPHRIGLVDGVLVPLDHDPVEIRREELLSALTGTPLACLRAIDEAHRQPAQLVDVRARLDHGDTAGALAVVENLLGPEATLRDGVLRDELMTAALRRVSYGLFRAGMADTSRFLDTRPGDRPGDHREHPRHARHPGRRSTTPESRPRPFRLHP